MVRQGECYEMQGQLVRALELYQASLRRLPGPTIASRVQRRIAVVVPQIASIRVDVTPTAPGAQLRLDGQPYEIGGRRKLDPGKVLVEIEAPTFQKYSQLIELAPGEERALAIALTPEVQASGPSPAMVKGPESVAKERPAHVDIAPSVPSTGSALAPLGYVLLAVGGSSLVASGVTGYAAMDRADFVKDQCPRPESCTAEGVAAARSGQTFSTLSTATLIGGSALVVLGAALVYLSLSSKKETPRVVVGGFVLTGSML